ncbi:MAG TPA: acetylxylan esterase [Planctomycetota bacterium]|nr:acetylxylan esterase [Planctomycetota bacterium]
MAQPSGANYDESKVPEHTLPDPLVCEDGTRVTSGEMWFGKRRPETLELFRAHVYGRSPARPDAIRFDVVEDDGRAFDGRARRKQIVVRFSPESGGPSMDLLVYLPLDAKGPVPLFVGLNFRGNHTIANDPAIRIPTSWVPNDREISSEHRASEKGRGAFVRRWPVELILSRGYGVATAYCGDIDPDFHDGFKNGIHSLFSRKETEESADEQWGTIAAWAWGLSRAMDWFERDEDIDQSRVAVLGHSRLGKTALWAGAEDERFAIVISNDSGCGGAALSRRRFGETVERINRSFPHWFCGRFKTYNGNEDALPVDQHQLIALIAPRPVYVASASEDLWADPRGEFLAAKGADAVYRLLGTDGLDATEPPPLDKPVLSTIGYHIRTGRHDITEFDWTRYLDFADRHFARETKRD